MTFLRPSQRRSRLANQRGRPVSDSLRLILEHLESRQMLTSFAFSFKHIDEAGAGDFLIDTAGMRKYSEWQSPPVTYWGPKTNGVEGRIVYKLPLEGPSSGGWLVASSNAWDFYNEPGGYGRGASALEVSADGVGWTTLRNSLEPRLWGQGWTYDDALPGAVLGTSEIWVRMRFLVEGAPNTSYTVAQFGRSTFAATKDVFAIRVETELPRSAPSGVALSGDSVGEHSAAGTPVGVFSTTDTDVGDTFNYKLVSGEGDTDNGSFTIVGTELRTAVVFDYGARDSYSIRVRSTDASGRQVAVSELELAGTAAIDVGLGKLAIPAGGVSPETLRGWLASGRNGGAWNGAGIRSTAAAATPFREVGVCHAAHGRSLCRDGAGLACSEKRPGYRSPQQPSPARPLRLDRPRRSGGDWRRRSGSAKERALAAYSGRLSPTSQARRGCGLALMLKNQVQRNRDAEVV
jgi:hypothetical protein